MSLFEKLAFWRQKAEVKPPNPERTLEGASYFTLPGMAREDRFWDFNDAENASEFYRGGMLVTPEIAMQVSTVWGCIDVQAKAIAASDWVVAEQISPKKRRVLYDDELTYILNTRPNADMTAQSFRRAMVIAVLAWGNAYAVINWNLANRIHSLYPIHPDRVRPLRNNGDLYFEIRNDDGTVTFLAESDLFRVRGPSIIGMLGVNRIGQAAAAIALSMATDEFSQAFFSNGAAPGGIVKVPTQLDDAAYARLQKQWNARHRGPRKAFNTAFLDNKMDYVPLPNKGNDSEMIESRKQDAIGICRYWGVPPHLVQILDNATFSNIEHQGLEFVRNCLRPIAREFNQEGEFKLFSARGTRKKLYLDLDWASEGDFKSRMEGFNIARNDGVLSANEIREEINWDDMGPDGDKHLVQGAMIELKDVGLPYKNKAKPTAKGASKGTAPEMPEEEPDEEGEEGDAGEEMARAWTKSVFASILRFKRNRLRDLGTQENAQTKARAATVVYMASQVDDLVKHLSAAFGLNVAPILMVCAKDAIDSDAESPDLAVETLFERLHQKSVREEGQRR